MSAQFLLSRMRGLVVSYRYFAPTEPIVFPHFPRAPPNAAETLYVLKQMAVSTAHLAGRPSGHHGGQVGVLPPQPLQAESGDQGLSECTVNVSKSNPQAGYPRKRGSSYCGPGRSQEHGDRSSKIEI